MHGLPALDGSTLHRHVREREADDRHYRRAIQSGTVVRVHRGVYADAADWAALGSRERHVLRSTAAVRRLPSRPVLSHRSAAAIWGIPLIGPEPPVVDVLVGTRGSGRTSGGVRRHETSRLGFGVVNRDGIAFTGLERTLVELCTTVPFGHAVAALDWALGPADDGESRAPTSTDALLTMSAELGVERGRRRVQRAIAFADGRSGSPGESLSRACLHELGFPGPELQVEFRDADGLAGIVDFWWPRYGLAGEFDGVAKYVREDLRNGMSVADAVLAEKRREDRIRALGPRFVRWRWADAMNPSRLARLLTAARLPSSRR